MTNNERRYEDARRAVDTVPDYPDDMDRETAVKDLLTNLMHLCEQDGLDFDKLVESAKMNFQAEINHWDDPEAEHVEDYCSTGG